MVNVYQILNALKEYITFTSKTSGSFLFSLQIRPKKGVDLVKWNLLDEVPEPNEFYGVKAYFVMITHGLDAPPMNVELEFEV